MHTHSIQQLGLTGIATQRAGERIALLILSMPVHTPNSAHLEALKHVYAGLLTSGSGSLSREQFLGTLSTLGSHIDVSLSGNTINTTLNALDTSLKKTLTLCETMFLKPTFQQSECDRIKEHLINQLLLAKEDAKGRAYQGFITALTQSTDARYSFPIDDIISHIKKVSVRDIKKFHESVWNSTWTLSCGGSQTSCAAMEKSVMVIRRKKHAPRRIVPNIVPTVPVTQRIVTVTDIPHKQNIEFSIGNVLPLRYRDPEFAAFVFGLSVLGIYGGFTGRLMSIVREKEGLTYSIYGQTEGVTKSENGFWRIATFFNPKDAQKGIRSTLREISRIREKGITSDEVIRFKTILATRTAMVEDSLIKKVRVAHNRIRMELTEDEFKLFTTDIQQMTKDRVNEALKKYLDPHQLVISGAGPVHGIKGELEAFTKK